HPAAGVGPRLSDLHHAHGRIGPGLGVLAHLVGAIMSELLVLLGAFLLGASGVPGLFLNKKATLGQYLTTCLAVIGGGLGLAGVGVFWAGDSQALVLPWSLPG